MQTALYTDNLFVCGTIHVYINILYPLYIIIYPGHHSINSFLFNQVVCACYRYGILDMLALTSLFTTKLFVYASFVTRYIKQPSVNKQLCIQPSCLSVCYVMICQGHTNGLVYNEAVCLCARVPGIPTELQTEGDVTYKYCIYERQVCLSYLLRYIERSGAFTNFVAHFEIFDPLLPALFVGNLPCESKPVCV